MAANIKADVNGKELKYKIMKGRDLLDSWTKARTSKRIILRYINVEEEMSAAP